MTRWESAHYRIAQFWHGRQATVTEAEMQSIRQWLNRDAYTLFARLPIDARRHALNVLAAVQTTNQYDADLAAAALLHDVGKLAAEQNGLHITLWLRGLLVLGEAVAVQRLQQLARSDPQTGWRYLLYVHFAHPQLGAAMAQQAGCSEQTCWLIAHHQDSINQVRAGERVFDRPSGKGTEPSRKETALAILQWADNRN